MSADTGMVVVAAVSKVKVGRLVPKPKPTIATPATSNIRAVALLIVSACPGLIQIISPRLAVQRVIAYSSVLKGALKVPGLPSEPPI